MCWWFRCWVGGGRRAALLIFVNFVGWRRWCGDPDKLGVSPGRRSPKFATFPFTAGANRGPQSSCAARKLLRVTMLRSFVSASVDCFGGGGLWRLVLALGAEASKELFVFPYFLEVLCVKCHDSWCFWGVLYGLRVVTLCLY
jgi:hypothetical protein